MSSHVIHTVSEISQVGEARRSAIRLADEAGFPETEKGQVAIVAMELATNLVRHAQHGKILLRPLTSDAGSVIEILTTDRHPGRADFGACLVDGYSTGGTPGNGLGAVKRMSRVFDFHSAPGAGTVVLAHVASQSSPATASSARFEWGAISVAAPGETVCGDAWQVENRDGNLCMMIADGLGHGPGAAEAAETACEVFRGLTPFSPKLLIERAHGKMTGTRGAAVAAASAGDAPELEFAGVGNIAASLHALDGSRGLMSHNGTVGAHMRTVHQLRYPWPAGTLLVMHSDGLRSRWTFSDHPGLIGRHPAVIAAVLLRDYCRGKDDASIVVVRRNST